MTLRNSVIKNPGWRTGEPSVHISDRCLRSYRIKAGRKRYNQFLICSLIGSFKCMIWNIKRNVSFCTCDYSFKSQLNFPVSQSPLKTLIQSIELFASLFQYYLLRTGQVSRIASNGKNSNQNREGLLAYFIGFVHLLHTVCLKKRVNAKSYVWNSRFSVMDMYLTSY